MNQEALVAAKIVKHAARLADLHLKTKEIEKFRRQLSRVLN